jgi:protein ImuA
MLWAAEQMLRSQAFGAVLVWLANARPEALRRSQVLAQAGDTVVWVLRPIRVLHESSPAVLRLAPSPLPGNLMSIVFHKRRGPVRDTPLLLPLEGMAHVPQRTGACGASRHLPFRHAVSSHHVADDAWIAVHLPRLPLDALQPNWPEPAGMSPVFASGTLQQLPWR